ncbi:MAG TPA: cache domain-containing protein, partial [Thermoanaerobaculia bacterium]
MARPRSGRLALAILLVALVAVGVALAVAAVLAVWGPGALRAPPGAAVDRAHAALAAAERERLARLSLAAQLLAAEEPLATVLRDGAGGAAALADLLAQRRPRLGFDLALVLDAEGRVVAAGEGAAVAAGTDLSAQPLVAAALADGAAAGAWRSGDGLAHVAVERVAPDFELLGHVLVGAAVDQVLALEAARASGAAVTFAAAGQGGAVPVASSLGDAAAGEIVAAAAAPGAPLAVALAEGEGREARIELAGGARRVLAVPLSPAAPGPPVGAAVLSAAAAGGAVAAVLPFAAGAAAGLLVALLLAPLVARGAFAPAARLAEAVEAAPRESFARRLEPRRYRALAPLAAALDRLFRVLHEERSLAAAAGAARRRSAPSPAVAGEAGPAVAAEPGAVALFDLRRYARLGDDARQAAADLDADLGRLRQAVEAAGGRFAGAAGHRALAAFAGDDAAWPAVSAAAAGLAAVAAARTSFDEGEPAAAAVASGRLASGTSAGFGGFLAGPAVQLAESVLRETAPGDLATNRAVHREIAERLAAHGVAAGEQRGLLSPQPIFVLGAQATEAVAGAAAPAP